MASRSTWKNADPVQLLMEVALTAEVVCVVVAEAQMAALPVKVGGDTRKMAAAVALLLADEVAV